MWCTFSYEHYYSGYPLLCLRIDLFEPGIYGLSYSTHQLVWPPWCYVLGWSCLGFEYMDPQAALLDFSKSWILSKQTPWWMRSTNILLLATLWFLCKGVWIDYYIIFRYFSSILFAILFIIKFLLILLIEYIRHIYYW